MNYFLDTDTLIYFLKGKISVVEKIASYPLTALATTIITHSELLFGAHNSTKKTANLKIINGLLKTPSIIPFCEASSAIFAELKASLKKSGQIIADLDLMIASICICHQATLVTNSANHFSRIKQLNCENWYCD